MIGCEAQELRYGLRQDHLLDIAQTRSENDDSANQLGMADGHLNSRGAAKALAEEIGLPNTVIEAQNNTIKRVDFYVAKAKLYERLRGQLNERQDKVIARRFREGIDGFKGGLSAENYISIGRTSRATATRDLQDLVEKGALTKTGELRHTRYHLVLSGGDKQLTMSVKENAAI
jgi:Fic family protein